MLKVLALQRESHVAERAASLSVEARITEMLDYLEMQERLIYTTLSECSPVADNAVKWADVLVLSKHSSREALALAKLANKSGKLIIYDIDDWIFSFPDYSGGTQLNGKLDLILEIIELADIVTVANKRIKQRVIPYAKKPVLIPNGIWVEKHIRQKQNLKPELSRPRIVFTNADLLKLQHGKDTVLTALQIFFLKHPEYILDFYGDPFPEMNSLPFLHFTKRIPYAQYMRSLIYGKYQFAITPLGGQEDVNSTLFNQCKNPFKYLNYGCAQIPGIYSDTDIYRDVIENQSTGVLTENSLDGWLDAMEQLNSDASLRERIRRNAYADILKNHHISRGAARFLTLIREADKRASAKLKLKPACQRVLA